MVSTNLCENIFKTKSKFSLEGSLDNMMANKTKGMLLKKVEFEDVANEITLIQTEIKEKYLVLNPSSSKRTEQANTMKAGNSDNPTHSVNTTTNGNLPNKATPSNKVLTTNGVKPGNNVAKDGLPVPKRVLFSSDKLEHNWNRSARPGCGLINLGVTCYINSSLQCLTYTPSLSNFLLKSNHQQTCRAKGQQFCMLCTMQNHLTAVANNSSGQSIKPTRIINNLGAIAKHLRAHKQEDAHEFIHYSIDAMQNASLYGMPKNLDEPSKNTTPIHQIFGGYLRSRVKCTRCKAASDTFDFCTDLNLSINKKDCNSIQGCLDVFNRPDVLSGSNAYKCSRCKTVVTAYKQMSICRAPNVLTIQLKRFSGYGNKVDKDVSYTSKLNIRKYMSNQTEEDVSYELYAVVVHSGFSSNCGHYYSYAKAPNGKWYCFDDTRVRQVTVEQVLDDQAYLLFYSRKHSSTKKQNDFKPIIDQHRSINTNQSDIGIPVKRKLQNGSTPDKLQKLNVPTLIGKSMLKNKSFKFNSISFYGKSKTEDGEVSNSKALANKPVSNSGVSVASTDLPGPSNSSAFIGPLPPPKPQSADKSSGALAVRTNGSKISFSFKKAVNNAGKLLNGSKSFSVTGGPVVETKPAVDVQTQAVKTKNTEADQTSELRCKNKNAAVSSTTNSKPSGTSGLVNPEQSEIKLENSKRKLVESPSNGKENSFENKRIKLSCSDSTVTRKSKENSKHGSKNSTEKLEGQKGSKSSFKNPSGERSETWEKPTVLSKKDYFSTSVPQKELNKTERQNILQQMLQQTASTRSYGKGSIGTWNDCKSGNKQHHGKFTSRSDAWDRECDKGKQKKVKKKKLDTDSNNNAFQQWHRNNKKL